MKWTYSILFIFSLLLGVGCNPQQRISGYYPFESECLRKGLDGSLVLRSYGRGTNKKEAINQAKKQAINDVLFEGIYKGREECHCHPIWRDLGLYEPNKQAFMKFFEDKGPYSKFVECTPNKRLKRYPAGNEVVVGVTLKLDLKGLQGYFTKLQIK